MCGVGWLVFRRVEVEERVEGVCVSVVIKMDE